MEIIIQKNTPIENPETRTFLADAFYPKSDQKLPLVIFVHGYKGYKDWGCWEMMAQEIAEKGNFVVTFNFSHNGTTVQKPEEFGDLEAFGENNYSKELLDLQAVIDYFSEDERIDSERIALIGHSRGGGISTIKANEDQRIKKLITLASVDTLDRFPKQKFFEQWKKDGVFYVLNGRTNQKMPHFFQFYTDYEQNKDRFSVENAAKSFKGEMLIIHGTEDEAVPVSAAENLHRLNPSSELLILEEAKHTFGAKEPWIETKLPPDLQKATELMIIFISK